MTTYNCYKCNYEWIKRKAKPKSCPRCKTRLDYVFKEQIDNSKEEVVVIDEDKEAQADAKLNEMDGE